MAVELHQAFLWTCDACGRDNFTRTVTVEEMAMSEDTREDYEEVKRVWGEGSDMTDVFCLMAPTIVTCEHCKESFPVSDDD